MNPNFLQVIIVACVLLIGYATLAADPTYYAQSSITLTEQYGVEMMTWYAPISLVVIGIAAALMSSLFALLTSWRWRIEMVWFALLFIELVKIVINVPGIEEADSIAVAGGATFTGIMVWACVSIYLNWTNTGLTPTTGDSQSVIQPDVAPSQTRKPERMSMIWVHTVAPLCAATFLLAAPAFGQQAPEHPCTPEVYEVCTGDEIRQVQADQMAALRTCFYREWDRLNEACKQSLGARANVASPRAPTFKVR